MPEAERLKVIDGIIEALKKKEREEAEEARREEYMAQREAEGSNLNTPAGSAPQEFTLNTDKSWYFYNTATRNAGRTDFQRRWGSRKLEDDWRRRNKASFAAIDEPGEEDDSADTSDSTEISDEPADSIAAADASPRATDPHFPEYYLRQIPVTDVQKATANEVIQEGLYNSGLILKDRMEDFSAAQAEWDKLMTRYPDNVYRLDVYYNRYLMHMRTGREDLAEPFRQRILSEFADATWRPSRSRSTAGPMTTISPTATARYTRYTAAWSATIRCRR